MFLLSCPFTLSNKTNRVLWEITSKCNMNCKHCLYFSSDEPALANKKDLPTESIFNIIDQIKKEGSVDAIWISGGEPLLRPDIYEIITKIKTVGLMPSISTNGSLINSDVASKLKKSGIEYVHVSIDGINAMKHDEFRRHPGAFDKVMSAVSNLKNEGIIVGATCIITNDNINDISAMVSLAIEKGISVLSFYMIEPLGRGAKLIHKIDQELMNQLNQEFKLLEIEYKDKIKLELFRTTFNSEKECLGGCQGERFLTITSDGLLGSCPWLMKAHNRPQSISLKTTPFEEAKEIVKQSMLDFKTNRTNCLTKCHVCIKKDKCLKGCPAVSGDDLYDPLCKLIRR